jgi:outer membrane protein assembly factor BamB
VEFLRKNLSWLLLGGAIIAGCGIPPPIIIDNADSDCEWNQGGGNFNRASYTPIGSSDQTALLWTRSFKRSLSVEPTAAYGKILVPTPDKRLHVISVNDGALLLKIKYKKAIVSPVIISDSLAVIIVDGEKMMVENWIVHQPLWEADLSGSFIEPMVMNGNIFWLDGNNYIRCHRLADGVRIWDRKLEDHCSCTIAGSSGAIFLSEDGGVIRCYEASSGNMSWEYDSGGRMRNPPVIVENHLIYCGTDGNVGQLNILDGSIVWQTFLNRPVYAPVASEGKGVFIGTNDRYIYRLDFDTGLIDWQRKIGGPVKAGPTLTETMVVFAGIDYRAYFVDKTDGSVLYRFETDGMLTTRPLACDGNIYIASEDKKLYCINISGED